MALRSIGDLRASIRRRLGWPSADTFVSNEAMAEMLQQAQLELHAFLTQIYQGDLRLATMTITVAADAAVATIPTLSNAVEAGVYRVLRVSRNFDGQSIPMRRLEWESQPMQETSQAWEASTDIRYRFVRYFPDQESNAPTGSSAFWFHPRPTTQQQVKIVFVPGLPSFSVTDAVNVLGHDEYLILDTMIKCLQAEEADTTVVERQKARYIEMVTQNETPIDMGQPMTILDVRSNDDGWWP